MHNIQSVRRRLFFLILLCVSIGFVSTPIVSAAGRTHEVRRSVKPLDLSRPPTTEELMAAGQLGGQLHPTEDIEIEYTLLNPLLIEGKDKIRRNREINLSFGEAIQEWNKHNYKEAVSMFRQHVKDYPDSAWASEADLHVGCDASYSGRYTEAEGMFTKIIQENKDRAHEGAKMLLNKARQRLANLKTIQGNLNEATKLYVELKKESPDWRHRTYASHWIQRISQIKSNELALLNCGTEALAHVLKKDGREAEAREIMDVLPTTLKGHSIKDLKSLAKRYGYKIKGLKLAISDLQNIPHPAIVQINAKNDGDKGHYWILEKIDKDELRLFDPQSGRRFTQGNEEFSREWDGNALVFAEKEGVAGKELTDAEMEQIYGGCCGAPAPESSLGNPGNQTNCGAPGWSVNMVNMNFYVSDTPLWYSSPIGPSVEITLSYNSQSAIAYHEMFGNKWQFNYGSFSYQMGNPTLL